jgi:2-polyprenyl-6-methoxyphenol hydroxylase-like FAD-dependent oxidoreductase
VAIAGGSLGGLLSAVALREAGCDVEVFERSAEELRGGGAGIVVQPELLGFMERYGVSERDRFAVASGERQYLAADSSVASRQRSHQLMTSWGALYRELRAAFPPERHHRGAEISGFDRDGDRVVVWFADGHRTECDLLVGADGVRSTCRRELLPDISPEYAGYVAWRGLVEEGDLPAPLAELFDGRFTFYQGPGTQILCYLVPGPSGNLAAGHRRLNWVWYWNVPAGDQLREVLTDSGGAAHGYSVPRREMPDSRVKEQRQLAEEVLPESFARLFGLTDEPFVQAIHDLAVPRMAFERVCHLGDAAFLPRPHTAASTSKAAVNGTALATELRESGGDAQRALRSWEPAQLELGERLKSYGQAVGDRSQFGR